MTPKHDNDLIWSKSLQENNNQFLRDFNSLIENFELRIQKSMGSITLPKKVNRNVIRVINGKLADIKKCFPECPGYASRSSI